MVIRQVDMHAAPVVTRRNGTICAQRGICRAPSTRASKHAQDHHGAIAADWGEGRDREYAPSNTNIKASCLWGAGAEHEQARSDRKKQGKLPVWLVITPDINAVSACAHMQGVNLLALLGGAGVEPVPVVLPARHPSHCNSATSGQCV